MAINLDKLIKAISSDGRKYSNLEQLVLDYGILTEQLKTIDQSSWYQKKGIEGTKNKIKSLKAEFEKIRERFNTPLDDLLQEKNRISDLYNNEISKSRRNTVSQIVIASTSYQLEFINEVIALKSRLENLEELDYYFENQGGLIELLGW